MDLPQLVSGFLLFVIPTIFALSLHEWAHAASAVALGDETPREQGRLTINPLAHMDLMGTVIVPLVLVLTTGTAFGWAKPVQISPERFNNKRVSTNTGLMLTAAAGPAMNLLLALITTFVWVAGHKYGFIVRNTRPDTMAGSFILVNLVLALFNMIPVPPLDGSRVVGGLLPPRLLRGYMRLEAFGPIAVALLFISGYGWNLIRPFMIATLSGMERVALLLLP